MEFELYAPLGTPEADAKIKELTGREPEQKSHLKATGKTGVVFGRQLQAPKRDQHRAGGERRYRTQV